jgi:hypothetical protein
LRGEGAKWETPARAFKAVEGAEEAAVVWCEVNAPVGGVPFAAEAVGGAEVAAVAAEAEATGSSSPSGLGQCCEA